MLHTHLAYTHSPHLLELLSAIELAHLLGSGLAEKKKHNKHEGELSYFQCTREKLYQARKLHTSMVGSLVGSNVGTIGDAVGYRVG